MRPFAALLGGSAMLVVAIACSQSPTAPSVLSLAGTWDGPGTNHLGNHMIAMTVAQSGTTLSGTVTTSPVDPVGSTCASCHMSKAGTFTGAITGTTLSLLMNFPSGNPADPTPHCATTITVALEGVTTTRIAGAYSGLDTCEGSFTGATLAMARH